MPVIVFLVESPLSQRDYERFGIVFLSERFDVRVVDLTPVIKPHFWAEFSSIVHHFDGYVAVSALDDVEDILPRGERWFVVDMLSDCVEAGGVRMLCRERGAKLIVVQGGLLPTLSLWAEVRNALKHFEVARIVGCGLRYAFRVCKGRTQSTVERREAADIVFLSGLAGRGQIAANSRSQLIPAHSFDYDIYLALVGSQPHPQWPSNYAVFLDEDMVYHSDYLHAGIAPPVTAEEYYPAMCRFFALYEEITNRKIIIAAHPKTDHDRQREFFASFDYVVGDTARLVQHASGVLLHDSTACGFAVLWHKPMLFLTMPTLDKSFMYRDITAISAAVGAAPISIESPEAILRQKIACPTISNLHYEAFKADFMKYSGSPDVSLWSIVAEVLDHGGTPPFSTTPDSKSRVTLGIRCRRKRGSSKW